MVGQIALTLALLTGASVLMRSLRTLSRTDLGVDTTPLTILRLDLPQPAYESSTRRLDLLERLEAGLSRTPAATLSLATVVPGAPAPVRDVTLEGPPRTGPSPSTSIVAIGTRYFETLDRTLLRGRSFTGVEGTPEQEVAIVNARFATLHFHDRDALGQRIRLTNPRDRSASGTWVTIVGVAPDIRQRGVGLDPPDPVVYVPLRRDPPASVRIIARAPPGRPAPVDLIRDEIRTLDADLPVFDVRRLDDWLAFLRWPQRAFGSMLTIFAGFALLMAAVGIYGVTAHAVETRRFEVGVRLAVGARATHVIGLFVRRLGASLALGLVLGLAGAVAFQRVLHSALVISAPNDGHRCCWSSSRSPS